MMLIILSIFSFILGSIIASFLGVVISRVPNHESIVKPASHCPNCGHVLKWYENIPLISFLALGGKCKSCKSKIGWFYFFIELIGGISFLLVFLRFQYSLFTIYGFILASLFIVMAGIDYQKHYIYDFTLWLFLALALGWFIYNCVINNKFILDNFIGLFVGFVPFLIISLVAKYLLKKEALGSGDIILMGIAGLLLGVKLVILALLFGSLLGMIIELSLIFTKKKSREAEIAFGPYLLFGIFMSFLYGNIIFDWYLGVML